MGDKGETAYNNIWTDIAIGDWLSAEYIGFWSRSTKPMTIMWLPVMEKALMRQQRKRPAICLIIWKPNTVWTVMMPVP